VNMLNCDEEGIIVSEASSKWVYKTFACTFIIIQL
jgi:hypothetical protein